MIDLFLVVMQGAQVRVLTLDCVVSLCGCHVIAEPRRDQVHAAPFGSLRHGVHREAWTDVEWTLSVHVVHQLRRWLLLMLGLNEDFAAFFFREEGCSRQVDAVA